MREIRKGISWNFSTGAKNRPQWAEPLRSN
jgi:hypothetical protein